jgi:hypothetical protein
MKSFHSIPARTAVALLTLSLLCVTQAKGAPASGPDADAAYIAKFQEKYKKVAAPPAFEKYATPARYDELFLGAAVDKATENVSNDSGGIAWGLSYQMMSLNEMYRNTHDIKYLNANLRIVQAVIAARDDKRNIKLWTGEIAPAWGCEKYAERGRAIFAVHTGIIVYPILDCLLLERDAKDGIGKKSELFQSILLDAEKSITFHERQWRDGPARDEGHYVGLNQENVLEGKPLPGNRLSSMGRALWISWKLTGNKVHYDHAIRLGKYIKHRLSLASDDAYYWPYSLPEAPSPKTNDKSAIESEDSSHGTLSVSFPILLAADGKVFTKKDMVRFGHTVTNGLGRLGGGVLLGNVTGAANSNPAYIAYPAYWLAFGHAVPEVRTRILDFYLNYIPTPGALDLALLLKYAH